MADKDEIRLCRLDECTFRQAIELENRGWEGYRENMSRFFPLMAPAPATEATTTTTDPNLKLDRLMDKFGTDGIRPGLSVVGFVGDKPVGFVFIAIRTSGDKKIAWNGGTAVFPEYRGRGIAKTMMIEADKVIRQQAVDWAVLEVVTANAHAISAYQAGGFHIVDQLISYTYSEALKAPFYEGAQPEDVTLQTVRAADVGKLPFYREKAAWGSMWEGMRDHPALIAHDAQGTAIGYALYSKSLDLEGKLKAVVLTQCEVSPELADRADRVRIFRLLLNEVYGPYNEACSRKTDNLSMSNPEPVAMLKEAGFERVAEQYLMIHEQKDAISS